VDLIILSGIVQAVRCSTAEEIQKSRSSSLVKAGMFASLLVFLISAILLR
jgi:hypothetical protein